MAETAVAAPRRAADGAAQAELRAFGALEWGLLVGLPLTWGSSFVLIAVGLETLAPAVITALRIAFGAATLVALPASRARLPRAAWPRVAALGVTWFALPLLLFPLAQRAIDSSLAGMLNGAVPLAAAAVGALVARRLPPAHQRLGLLVGFAGVVAISLPSAAGARATAVGVALVLAAVASYGVALNLAAPLQQRHGALPVLLRAQAVALVLVAPVGLWGLRTSTFAWSGVAAVAVLGVAGTGLAFWGMTVLVGRVGPTRGAVAVYFTPLVAIALGVVLRGERVAALALAGGVLVVLGAWLTSRVPGGARGGRAAARASRRSRAGRPALPPAP